jgi:hypothetical protein
MATAEPGDRRPARLRRPPSSRYEPAASGLPRGAEPARAAAFGALAALGVAAVWLIVAGVLGLDYGAVLVGVGLGWLVGTAVAYGAYGEAEHVPDGRIRGLAVGLALCGWGLGVFLDYLWSQLTLPASQLTLPERLAAEPFPAWVAGQVSPLLVAAAVIVGVFAWRAAR